MLKVSSFVRCPGQHLQERRFEVGASYTSYDNRRYISLKYQTSQNVPPLVGLHQTVRQGRRTSVAASSSSSSSLQSSNNEASGGFVLWLLQVIQVTLFSAAIALLLLVIRLGQSVPISLADLQPSVVSAVVKDSFVTRKESIMESINSAPKKHRGAGAMASISSNATPQPFFDPQYSGALIAVVILLLLIITSNINESREKKPLTSANPIPSSTAASQAASTSNHSSRPPEPESDTSDRLSDVEYEATAEKEEETDLPAEETPPPAPLPPPSGSAPLPWVVDCSKPVAPAFSTSFCEFPAAL